MNKLCPTIVFSETTIDVEAEIDYTTKRPGSENTQLHAEITPSSYRRGGRRTSSTMCILRPEVDREYFVGHRYRLRSQETLLSELLAVSSSRQTKTMACHNSLLPSSCVFPALQEDLIRLLMKFPRLEVFQIVHGDAPPKSKILYERRCFGPSKDNLVSSKVPLR